MSGIYPKKAWPALENQGQCLVFTPVIAKIGGLKPDSIYYGLGLLVCIKSSICEDFSAP